MSKILILHNYDGFFATSLKSKGSIYSADTLLIKKYLESFNHEVEIFSYSDINLDNDYSKYFVLYSSSEDPGLFYKDYIEDILLRLQFSGAVLLPSFDFFRAHHNKMYMELLKTSYCEELNTIKTYVFAGIDEFKSNADLEALQYPVVVKSSAGSGSSGVILAHNKGEVINAANKVSKCSYMDLQHNFLMSKCLHPLRNIYRLIKGRAMRPYKNISQKFIIQTFIHNLKNDYKVLVFGEKYYVLNRDNRDNDFRASGSGKFSFPSEISKISNILDFAHMAYGNINTPMASLDIGFDGEKCHLIEFQSVHFGPYTLEYSEWYFSIKDGNWTKTMAKSSLEMEYANAINLYLQKKY